MLQESSARRPLAAAPVSLPLYHHSRGQAGTHRHRFSEELEFDFYPSGTENADSRTAERPGMMLNFYFFLYRTVRIILNVL